MSFIEAIDTLLAYGVLEDDSTAEGIAKKISADEGTQDLSERQMNVFHKYIEPYLTPDCEKGTECMGDQEIAMEDLPQAYLQRNEYGGLYCEECLNFEVRLENFVASDD